MKERSRKNTVQKEKDDAIMNFVFRQAQEAILDPNLPKSYKDEVVEGAVGVLLRIAEKRSAYNPGRIESRQLKQSDTLYKEK